MDYKIEDKVICIGLGEYVTENGHKIGDVLTIYDINYDKEFLAIENKDRNTCGAEGNYWMLLEDFRLCEKSGARRKLDILFEETL